MITLPLNCRLLCASGAAYGISFTTNPPKITCAPDSTLQQVIAATNALKPGLQIMARRLH